MLIFVSDYKLRVLGSSKRWHSDRTFDSAPHLFKQHYIIHALYKEHLLACDYVAFTSKCKKNKQDFI